MSLKDYREALLDRLLTFLWRQWSALGVLGESSVEDEWIIDPEPLLVFTLDIARYEPRLFDEVLAWLLVNSDKLDASRLRRILSDQEPAVLRVVGAALRWAQEEGKQRKWKNLADYCRKLCQQTPRGGLLEPLFKEKSGKFHPRAEGDKIDPSFRAFDLNRPRIRVQKKAGEVPVNAKASLRFLMRGLFGTGAKSETLLYLLTHEGGRPREIADSVGHFWLSVHQTLLDLSRSGLVLKKPHGRRIEYWIPHAKWWQFLTSTDFRHNTAPQWLDWISIYSGLSTLWRTVDAVSSGTESDYMKSSKLQDSLEILAREFSRVGYHVGTLPSMSLSPEQHQKLTLRFLSTIFDLRVQEKAISPTA
ncbi:MAG: hypothetical protein SF051_10960 [Elusimicrobiota bacterium]|nr:hypothetical protein [Elusimicrobiota bacterium]